MKKQVLSPAMEYGKEADLGARMMGSAAITSRPCLVSNGSDLFGHSADDMKVVWLENFGRSLLDPLRTRE